MRSLGVRCALGRESVRSGCRGPTLPDAMQTAHRRGWIRDLSHPSTASQRARDRSAVARRRSASTCFSCANAFAFAGLLVRTQRPFIPDMPVMFPPCLQADADVLPGRLDGWLTPCRLTRGITDVWKRCAVAPARTVPFLGDQSPVRLQILPRRRVQLQSGHGGLLTRCSGRVGTGRAHRRRPPPTRRCRLPSR
jgi:hypothetical protein